MMKLSGSSQKQHLICCFCCRCLAQNESTGRPLNRKLLYLRLSNLFMNFRDLQIYAKEIKSVSPSFYSNCKTFIQPNFFFTYLLIRLTAFCPKPHLRQQLSLKSTSSVMLDRLRILVRFFAYLDGRQKLIGYQLIRLFLISFQTSPMVAIQMLLPLADSKEQYDVYLLVLFITSYGIVELTIQVSFMEARGHPFNHKKKLTLEKEEGVDPLFHLFTQVPLTTIEKKPELFQQTHSELRRSQQSSSLRSNRSLNHSSSVDSFRQFYPLCRRPNHKQRSPSRSRRKINLKKVLLQTKKHVVIRSFVQKMKRNNTHSKPVDLEEVSLGLDQKVKVKGWILSDELKLLWGLLASIVVMLLGVSQSLVLAFSELQGEVSRIAMLIVGITLMIGELCYGLLIIRRQRGKYLENLSDIFKVYWQGYLPLDGAIFIVLIVILISSYSLVNSILLVLLLVKMTDLPAKLRPIDSKIHRHPKLGKFWPYIRLIILNLLIAHAIGIVLNLVVDGNQQGENWQVAKGIGNACWFERYVWSFYWSVSMMTTVGFGDIAPVSYSQALWVILIEIACCLVLVYNLTSIVQLLPIFNKKASELGNFENLAESAQINSDIKYKVMNYLQRKEIGDDEFNVVRQNAVIKQLPVQLKKQVQQQFVQRHISNLPYFRQLHPKTISRLAQHLQRKLYMPGEMIKPYDDALNIYVLEKGEIAYLCRSDHPILSNVIINTLQATPNDRKLLNLDFITRERGNYDIRSATFSTIIQIPYDSFKKALSACKKDFEFYCSLRDRSKHLLDEFQLIPCNNCQTCHSKAACPKLHFMPYRQMVITRYLKGLDDQNIRNSFQNIRLMRRKMSALSIGKFCRQEYGKAKVQELNLIGAKNSNAVSLNRSSNSQVTVGKNGQYKPSSSESDCANLLSQHFCNQLREQRMEDGVWLLNCDIISDYLVYFPEGNLSAVIGRLSQALKRRMQCEI